MKTKIMRTVLVYLTALVLSDAVASAQNVFIGIPESGIGVVVEVTTSGKTNIFYSNNVSGGPLAYPEGMVFDSAGDLFVADTKFEKIYEFANNNGTLSSNVTSFAFLPIATGGQATWMAFDRTGDLLVSCPYTNPFAPVYVPAGVIFEYTNHNGTLSTNASIFAGGLYDPLGLAFDRAGNLFISNGTSNTTATAYITEIATNGTQSTFYFGLPAGGGLAFDGAGNLYVGQKGHDFVVLTTNATVTTNYPYANNRSNVPSLAFNSSGDLFGIVNGVLELYTLQGKDSLFFSFSEISPAPFGISSFAFQPTPLLQGAATNGVFQLTVTMPSPYYATIVQSSPDLVNWSNVYSNTPPFTFTDSLAAPYTFYRAVLDTNYY